MFLLQYYSWVGKDAGTMAEHGHGMVVTVVAMGCTGENSMGCSMDVNSFTVNM